MPSCAIFWRVLRVMRIRVPLPVGPTIIPAVPGTCGPATLPAEAEKLAWAAHCTDALDQKREILLGVHEVQSLRVHDEQRRSAVLVKESRVSIRETGEIT